MIEEATQKLALLLQGKVPEPLDTQKITDQHEQKFAMLINRLFSSVQETHAFISPLSKGKLEEATIPPAKNFFASPFKELHMQMQHLTWQAQQVANGDYSQRVDFMGEFSEAFNTMIVALDEREQQLKKKIEELEGASTYIRNLEGFLPICANCKKIRLEGDDHQQQEQWVQIERYFSKTTSAKFSHSICPECRKTLYPDMTDEDLA
jgi:hypothetical protein